MPIKGTQVRIAVNTRLLLPGKLEGIGWFTYETLKRITRAHPEHQFFFLFDRPWSEDFRFGDNVTPMHIPPQARHPVLYYIWFDLVLPGVLKKIRADLFISPDGYLPPRLGIPSLNIIHDLNFEHYPEDIPYLERLFYRHFFPRYARQATRIATVSSFSKEDIQKQYGIPADKIDVVYNGAGEHFTPLDPLQIRAQREKHSKGLPYFVFVGSQIPRKNLARLFQAFDRLRISGKKAALVVCGQKKWWNEALEKTWREMRFKEDVVFTGRLSREALKHTLGAATALTYVSYFEGFGIPILEAFRSGVPVITSNTTSMPEVAGEAALLVDPFDVHSIQKAMESLLEDRALQARLVEKGLIQANKFSWDDTAARLWAAIEKTASNTAH